LPTDCFHARARLTALVPKRW